MNFVRLMFGVSLIGLFSACNAEDKVSTEEPSSSSDITISPIKTTSFSDVESELSDEQKTKLLSKFAEFRSDIAFSSLAATPVEGLYAAEFEGGGLIYITESGEYFISGEIFKLDGKQVVNVTEEGRAEHRRGVLENLDRDELITFPAEGDDIVDIYVFTDVSCGFCVKLHKEVDELAKLGVRVNYLAFPRGGQRSPAYAVMQSVWCADDRQQALTDAKSGKSVPPLDCASSTVLDQFAFGASAGVNATPAIMFADGSLQLGYKPSAELASIAKSRR